MSNNFWLTAPSLQLMHTHTPSTSTSTTSTSRTTFHRPVPTSVGPLPRSVNSGTMKRPYCAESDANASCAPDDVNRVKERGECALLRLSGLNTAAVVSDNQGDDEFDATIADAVRYGMHLHRSGSLNHAICIFDLVQRRARAPAERAFASVNLISLFGKSSRPVSSALLTAADRDIQLAFLAISSASGAFVSEHFPLFLLANVSFRLTSLFFSQNFTEFLLLRQWLVSLSHMQMPIQMSATLISPPTSPNSVSPCSHNTDCPNRM